MKFSKMLSMAWLNLKERRLRTSLTTLGVVIGIATILSVAFLGEGFRGEVKQRMEQGFELDVLIVFPGSLTAGLREGFSQKDIEYVKNNITGISLVTPLITIPLTEEVRLCNETGTRLGAFTIGAVNFTEMRKMLPQRFNLMNGSFPGENEKGKIVLGYKASIVNETIVAGVGDNVTLIMPASPPLRLLKLNFTVSGVLAKSGTSGITNFDYWAFISIEDAFNIIKKDKPYQVILVKVSNVQDSERIAKEIERHFGPYSVTIFVPTAFTRQVSNILSLVQMFLVAIGSISLLVAGVGIMNIMTVAVLERTREIGILKAVGAKNRTVLGMFLTEALLIGIIGGLIGEFTGCLLSYTLTQILNNFLQPARTELLERPETQTIKLAPIISPTWMIVAFAFAIAICIIFGLYPARRASKLNPVEALRYE
jgi:putative ABC transport system permease protein